MVAKQKTPKKKAGAKKAAPKENVSAGASGNPWNALSDSTLKRKTVAQLTSYLSERQITVTDETGKAFKKAVLVEAVRNL